MNAIRKYLLVIIITAVPILSFAQSNLIASVSDSNDIKGQFEYLYKKSNSFEQFKVIPINSTILFLMYKRGHQVVMDAKIRLKEVQEDLENLRKSGILREQKLGHELISYKLKHPDH